MGLTSAAPQFSAGPLLMPPIQVPGISERAPEISRGLPEPVVELPNGQFRFSFWPCLRKLGSRCLHGARVMPLTLSQVIDEEASGSPDLHRDEHGRWVPGQKKPVMRTTDDGRAAGKIIKHIAA